MTIEMIHLSLFSRILEQTHSGTLTAEIDGMTVTVEWPEPALSNTPTRLPAQAPIAAPTVTKPTEQPDKVYVRAPMVGILSDSAFKFGNGDSVSAGDTLLELQTGDRKIPVKATVTGTVIKIRNYEKHELIHCGRWLIAIQPA